MTALLGFATEQDARDAVAVIDRIGLEVAPREGRVVEAGAIAGTRYDGSPDDRVRTVTWLADPERRGRCPYWLVPKPVGVFAMEYAELAAMYAARGGPAPVYDGPFLDEWAEDE